MVQMFRSLIFGFLMMGLATVSYSVGEAQDDLLLWFSFEGSGDVAKDLSGNGNDGNIVAKRTDGKYGKGISMGKEDEYVEMDNILQQVGTIEFWFKPNWDGDAPETYRLFDASAGAFFWSIGKGEAVGIRVQELGFFHEDAADNDYMNQINSDVISAGQWYHLAGTWDFENKESKFYLNGEEVASTNGMGDFPLLSPKIRIGNNVGPKATKNGPDSVIDEFAIYAKVLEADEIKRDMETSTYVLEPVYGLPTMWGKVKSEVSITKF